MIASTVLKVSLFISLPAVALAQHGHGGHAGHGAPQARKGQINDRKAVTMQADQPGVQKTCPVTGKPIKPGVSLEQDGQKVGFCCEKCVDTYKENTAKYAPALYRQIHAQQVQVKCPVMGGDVDPAVSIEYRGQKISFCCRGCDDKFKKTPVKYAEGLKNAYIKQVHCPVSGEAVDPQYKLAAGRGDEKRTVYFCSEECIAEYKTEPGKYEHNALPAAGLIAHGKTAKDDIVLCPVCAADANFHRRGEVRTAEHKGSVYFLSTAECEQAFKADPDKYAGKPAERAKLEAVPARQTVVPSAKPVHGGACCPH